MIDVTIKMIVSADKRNEVLITIKGLLGQIRRDHGCISCHCYLDVEAEDVVILKQAWKTNEALKIYLRSGYFKVLLGAMKLLTCEPEISFNTVVATEDMEAIVTTRGE
jgi:quinol monooxygenase YgiN